MEELFAYHAVTEKPMYIGQHIVFDKNHHNGVWQRVNCKQDIVSDIYNNPNINELNGYIQQISQELGCYYIDINEKFDDSQGNLSAEFSTDGFHILGKYYSDWVQWLKEQMSPAF